MAAIGKRKRSLAHLCVLSLIGLSSASVAQTISIDGWNGANVYSNGQAIGFATAIDINGEVGYQLTVIGPRAHCSAGGWSGTTVITSGQLPPGLVKDDKDYISGVPTERGHWIVELTMNPLSCGGATFWGFSQKLLFHISGSGKVIQ